MNLSFSFTFLLLALFQVFVVSLREFQWLSLRASSLISGNGFSRAIDLKSARQMLESKDEDVFAFLIDLIVNAIPSIMVVISFYRL
jgi:hypothetical protein